MPAEPRETVAITEMLRDARAGDADALDRAYAALYDELKAVARVQLRRNGANEPLRTTELVHEAYVRLHVSIPSDLADRSHFLALSARAMRHVLVDHFRKRASLKRGGGRAAVTLFEDGVPAEEPAERILALDEALDRLSEIDDRLKHVVECRFFGGMTEVEIASSMGITDRTVRNYWRKAKAWLAHELGTSADA